jgi:hypothetical protein
MRPRTTKKVEGKTYVKIEPNHKETTIHSSGKLPWSVKLNKIVNKK